MCGICGELRFDGRAADLGALGRMTERLQRRGPDRGGSYSDGPVGLGHRRLAIIDLSERSSQPMVDQELGLALVFNGTIYNYRALRDELRAKGYHFFSDGDSEVILKAWHAWGQDCAEHLHGMFAFGLWDMRRRSLFLARDRLGIKPLYFSADAERLRFASNPQSLLAGGGVDTALDAVALHHQFTLHGVVPAPLTVLKGVRKLPPASWMLIDAQGVQQSRCYWRLEARRPEEPMTDQDWLAAMHEALRGAVRKRNEVADVPVGVLLSGGLDSSLLVALLAESGVNRLKTFSVGFEDQPEEKGSEFEYSDQVVEWYATDHRKIHVPNADALRRLPEAVEPWPSPCSARMRWPSTCWPSRSRRRSRWCSPGRAPTRSSAAISGTRRCMADAWGSPLERFARHYFDRDHEELMGMLSAPFRGADHTGELIAGLLAEPGSDSFLDAVLRMDVTTLIVDDPVKRVDNMTMAWGLEARVPFLDQHLVELAARCPPELKLREGGKHPLKAMARGLLPDAVIDRPKGYFPMPALKYVRGEFLGFMRDILDSRACRERGLYSRAYLDLLLAAPEMHHTRIRGSKLWHCALLEYWLQRHVDPAS